MINPVWHNIFRRRGSEDSLRYFLSTLPFFVKLDRRDLKCLESLVHIRTYQADEAIFGQGDLGTGMYIIRTGKVQIFTNDDLDHEHSLALLEQGDFFGEIALTASRARSASAKALEPTVLVGLFRSDMIAAVKQHPQSMARILLGLNRIIGDRLLHCNQQLEETRKQLNRALESARHD